MENKEYLLIENEKEHIIKFLQAKYQNLDRNSITINRLLGGLSRKTNKVEIDNNTIYLVRIFSNDDSRVNKEIVITNNECNLNEVHEQIMKLNSPSESLFFKFFSMQETGPEYIGELHYDCVYENKSKTIRFEKFLEGRQILPQEIMKEKYFFKVAVMIGKLHSFFDLDDTKEDKNYIFKKLTDNNLMKMFDGKCNLDLYDDLDDRKFIEEISTFTKESNVNKILSLLANKSQVLSHNDLWVGNIFLEKLKSNPNTELQGELKEKLHLIDLEMMDFNINGYDLGKFLYEPMIGRFPGSIKHYLIEDGFPDDKKINNFLVVYILSLSINKSINKKLNENEIIRNFMSNNVEEKLIRFFTSNEIVELDFENEELFMTNIKSLLLRLGFYKNEEEVIKAVKNLESDCYIGIIASCYWLIIICVICGRAFTDQMDLFQFAKDEFYVFKKFSKKLNLNLD